MPQSISISCCGKINLALAVAPPLPADHPSAGMHPITSWFAPIAFSDTLTINLAATSTYDITFADLRPVDWPLERDLAARAHRALEHHLARPLPVSLQLVKHIPPGSGLGGGSSNAAHTLIALNRLFQLNLAAADLRAIASSLGSDIPFFIDDHTPPRPAIVTGLGHAIERLAPTFLPIILIIPPIACPTGPVYKAFDTLPPPPDRHSHIPIAAQNSDTTDLFNDLWPAACLVAPSLQDIRRRAAAVLTHPIQLSGSGSALFAIAPAEAAPALRSALPECRILVTHTLAPGAAATGASP